MEAKSSWVSIKPEHVEQKIIELAKEGNSPEKIGLILRDRDGIPRAKLLGVRIKKVLEKAKLWNEPENLFLKNKIETLGKHIKKHKHDYSAHKSLIKKNARVNTLRKR